MLQDLAQAVRMKLGLRSACTPERRANCQVAERSGVRKLKCKYQEEERECLKRHMRHMRHSAGTLSRKRAAARPVQSQSSETQGAEQVLIFRKEVH